MGYVTLADMEVTAGLLCQAELPGGKPSGRDLNPSDNRHVFDPPGVTYCGGRRMWWRWPLF